MRDSFAVTRGYITMCVIAFAESRRITPTEVNQMWDANPDGGGIAWRETIKGKKTVCWAKGLNRDQMLEHCATVPLPYVAHFRISTVDKPPKDYLTHPFPIHPESPCYLEGQFEGPVLFHNGHHGPWREELKQTLRSYRAQLNAEGKFNDTRAMAVISYYMGHSYMETTEQRAIIFSPDDIEIFVGNDAWEEVDGIYVSNDRWQKKGGGTSYYTGYHRHSNYTPSVCKGGCGRTYQMDSDGYCSFCKHKKPTATETSGTATSSGTNPTQPVQTQVHQPPALPPATNVGVVRDAEVVKESYKSHQGGRRLNVDPFIEMQKAQQRVEALELAWKETKRGKKGLNKARKYLQRMTALVSKKQAKDAAQKSVTLH